MSKPGHFQAQKLYPLLGQCEHHGCDEPAYDRHHRDGDTDNNDRENVEFLCRRHHMLADGRLEAFKRNGQHPKQAAKSCSNCGRSYKPLRRGRCAPCAKWIRLKGEERPYRGDGRRERYEVAA